MAYGNYFIKENSIQGHLRKKKLEEKDGRLRLYLTGSKCSLPSCPKYGVSSYAY